MKEEFNYLNNLLKVNDKIVICLSGGPDSMCLLSLLIEISKQKKLYLIAAHVNHNVRRVSAKEKIFVENYCQKNNVIFESMKIENYHDDNFHNEARNIRYKYFEEIVKKYHAKYLMTAHHGDDLIETVLMRIVRGSNLNGYAGFKKEVKRTNYTIIRPLINITKEEILQYNKLNKIPFVTDLSNKKDKYTRNRYRKNILPFLKKEDPKVHEKFLKFSNTINQYNEYLEGQLQKEYQKTFKDNILEIKIFNEYAEIIKNRIVEKILEDVYHDDLFLINDTHTKEILALIANSKTNLTINLPSGLRVRKSYGKVIFVKEADVQKDYEYELRDSVFLPNNKTIKLVKESNLTSNYVTRLSSVEVALPLKVRNRHQGDKMAVKKMSGQKKIKDIFIDEKIDLVERDLWPIVVDANDVIIWLPGLKKSKFDKSKKEKYDIIIKYN